MTKDILKILSCGLDDLLNQHDLALSVISHDGIKSIEHREFEAAEICIKNAFRQKQKLEHIRALCQEWNLIFPELQLDSKLQIVAADSFDSEMTVLNRLHLNSESLMRSLIESGAAAFSEMNFEHAQDVCRSAGLVQNFQMKLHEFSEFERKSEKDSTLKSLS